ncbi:hypothetical protein, conserved [Babesia ovata]|uniref:Extracellular matrix-binding ebh n=1 Tax=Babesia ovata TaxID=189622 RepID=A0A2H6KAG8_9APIC|nr:uncharacterized protein BOVATA_014900 [Babesia ovata]GBE59997.1 hypothetical protein, conserved [Babesia ovata]
MTNKINKLKSQNNFDENKLNKLQSDLSSHKSEVHNNTSKRDNALKDVHSRMVSLAELSVKLGQFIGNSDVITTVINNGIDSIINSDNDFKSLRNSPSSPVHPPAAVSDGLIKSVELDEKIEQYSQQIELLKPKIEQHKQQKMSVPDELNKSHESHQSKLDALQKLKSLNESLSSLNNNHDNNCKNLLTNLCSGLEKFLGYQETSKGYDGTGIVYSDLDRLCDGVMSFILQCLEGAKTLLHHYYPQIIDTIRELEGKIGKGSGVSGFCDAIGRVQAGLEGYERSMENLTNAVVGEEKEHKGTIKALKTKIEGNIKALRELNIDKFDDVVGKWYKSVTEGLDENVKNIGEAIKMVDGPLRNKVINDFEKIQTRIESLSVSAINDVKELKELSENVADELRELEGSVKGAVEERVNEYKKKLEEEFKNIQEQITAVERALTQVKSALDQWILKAKEVVQNAMQKVTDVVKILNGKNGDGKNTEKAAVEKAAEMLKDKAEKLMKAIDKAGTELASKVGSAENAVEELDKMLKQGLFKVKGLINKGLSNYVEKLAAAFAAGIEKADKYWYSGADKPGFTAFMSSFNAGTLEPNTHLGTWLRGIGNTNPDVGGGIERILYPLNSAQSQWKAESAKLTKALTDDLHGKVEEWLPKDATSGDSSEKVNLKSLTSYISRGTGSKHVLDEAIKSVKRDVKAKLDDIKYPEKAQTAITKDRISTAHSTFTEQFNKYIAAVEKLVHGDYSFSTKDHLNSYLVKLKRMLTEDVTLYSDVTKGLGEINTDIDKTLGTAITGNNKHTFKTLTADATKFLKTTIPQEVTKCINEIRRQVNTFVKQSIKNVKKDALDRYVTSRSNELAKVKDFVESQRVAIEKIIKKDRSNGVKDFLRELKKQLNEKICDIIMPHGTVTDGYKTVNVLATKLSPFFDKILHYTIDRLTQHTDIHSQVKVMSWVLKNFFTGLIEYSHFSHEVSTRVCELADKVDRVTPLELPDAGRPVLVALKSGVRRLVDELNKQYVSAYSMEQWKRGDAFDQNCASVLLTIIPTLNVTIDKLRSELEDSKNNWWNNKIHSDNALGNFLASNGFDVSTTDGQQNGELRNCDKIKGADIYEKMCETIKNADRVAHLQTCIETKDNIDNINLPVLTQCLSSHLEEYYKTSVLRVSYAVLVQWPPLQ